MKGTAQEIQSVVLEQCRTVTWWLRCREHGTRWRDAESLCRTPETHATLGLGYTAIQNNNTISKNKNLPLGCCCFMKKKKRPINTFIFPELALILKKTNTAHSESYSKIYFIDTEMKV